MKLPPFELDDTEEYWEAAAINADERGAGDVSSRIRRVDHGMREVILALHGRSADYALTGDRLCHARRPAVG